MEEELPESVGEMAKTEATISLEVQLSDIHAETKREIDKAGVNVEEIVSQKVQPQVEQVLHDIYQQGRYQQ